MSDTLASRMVVNVLGIPGILLLVYAGRFYFALFVAIVCLLALREFYAITSAKSISPQVWLGLMASLLITLFYYAGLDATIFEIGWQHFLMIIVLVVFIVELFRNRENATANIATTLSGILYVPVLLAALILLRQIDPLDYRFGMRLTMSLFFSVWVCDSAAYFIGKKWGEKKIMPRVSPQKSVAGCAAGVAFATLVYLILFWIGFLKSSIEAHSLALVDAVILGIITGVFGQTGDFVESLIKRDAGVKDSSGFLLGHGGVLDRFDSLIIASPMTYLYLKIFVY